MKAYSAIGALRKLKPFAKWLDPVAPSRVGPLVMLDADGRPAILRVLMSRGGYVDIGLIGDQKGRLVATGPGAGMVDDYAILFSKIFKRTPELKMAWPELLEEISYSTLSQVALDNLIRPIRAMKWYCDDYDDEILQKPNWCVPRCISIVSKRFSIAVTQEEAAAAWGQGTGDALPVNNANAFARFASACRQWGMNIMVAPSDARQVTYDWFSNLKVPTVFGSREHAWVCVGTCDIAFNSIGDQFKGVAVIDPSDGQEQLLTTDSFGDRIEFAVEAPGEPCHPVM